MSNENYEALLKKRYDEMNQRVLKGDTKGLSMIDVMKPAQDLYNYCMMKLQDHIE